MFNTDRLDLDKIANALRGYSFNALEKSPCSCIVAVFVCVCGGVSGCACGGGWGVCVL